MNRFIFAALALVLAACSHTSGKKIEASDLQSFTVGKTTLPEVESRLGSPKTSTIASDGTTTLIYNFAQSEGAPLFGGVSTQSQTSILTFDPAGKLKTYNQGNSQANR